MEERLKKQLDFLLEIDREKEIYRQTHILGGSRRENDAEHAWHMAIMAFVLQEYANEPVDILRVMKMVLMHDLVEIYAGDTYAYDETGKQSQREREVQAADRIYGMLPEDQAREFRAIWEEFEERCTPEAKFARMLDNYQPLSLNNANHGGDWKAHDVARSQVEKRNEISAEGSRVIGEVIAHIIEENVQKGNLRDA
jgi:putative hydrolase of HD superfamily